MVWIEIMNWNNRTNKNVNNNIMEMLCSSDFEKFLNMNDIKLK